MSDFQSKQSELQLLVELLDFDGLQPEQDARLMELAASDAALRQYYLNRIFIYGKVRRLLCAGRNDRGFSTPLQSTAKEVKSVHPSRLWPISLTMATFAIASLVLVLAMVAAPDWRAPRRVVKPSAVETAPVYAARVSGMRNAVWEGERDWQIGESLRVDDEMHLQEGLVTLVFDSGARVSLTGPARFRAVNENRGSLFEGRLAASVPKRAIGFQLNTPGFDVIDLGTEFGVHCRENGRTEVHVFEGKVEVVPSESAAAKQNTVPRRVVRAGEAVVIEAQGTIVSQEAKRAEFGPVEISRDAELIGFYPFNGDARDASGNERHASHVENVEFVEGREGKAARFHDDGRSYIRLPINADASALPRMTWGAWVRPRRLSLGTNHMILSTDDGQYDRVLTLDSRFEAIHEFGDRHRFATFAGDLRGVVADEEREIELDRWTFLAASYDQPRRELSFYVERSQPDAQGRKLRQIVHRDTNFNASQKEICVGNMGNRGVKSSEQFFGDVDNVFVFKGVLTHDELEQIAAGGERVLRQFILQKPGEETFTTSER